MKIKKEIVAATTAVGTTATMVVPALASTGTANQAVVDAMTTTSNDMVATGTAIIPVALVVIGLSLVVTFGVKLFKRISSKG